VAPAEQPIAAGTTEGSDGYGICPAPIIASISIWRCVESIVGSFHVMKHLGEALDKIRKAEYAWLGGKQRQFIKGQKYTLLSHPQNLTGTAKKNLKLLLAANNQLSPTRFHDDPTFKKPICNAVPSRIAKP
jgi:hypothetical protein